MKKLYMFLNLAPAPLFALGLIVNLTAPATICGSWQGEMTLMWAVMLTAHLSPWIIWYQQHFTRD
jgi:hypothetical protein